TPTTVPNAGASRCQPIVAPGVCARTPHVYHAATLPPPQPSCRLCGRYEGLRPGGDVSSETEPFLEQSADPPPGRDVTEHEVLRCRTIANHLASATVRTLALEALQASSDQLTAIMRSVDEGIVAQSASGTLVYANEAAARLIGFASAAELLAADRRHVLGR